MKMSKERKVAAMAALHTTLVELLGRRPQLKFAGICGNVCWMMLDACKARRITVEVCDDADRILRALAATWPGRGPDRLYPVEGQDAYYRDCIALWDNPRRLQLLNYLIERTGSYGHD